MPPAIKLRSNTPLAPLTTLKVGGAARYFVEVSSEDELIKALGFAKENDLNLFILGGGSNVVISDSGFDGLVVKIAIKGMIETARERKRVELSVGAGEEWDSFVAFAVDRGLTGVECLSGIPGLVGGTPIQNVGAYGQEVSETIVSVRCLDRLSGAIVEMANADCSFSYRKSIFNSTCRDRYIVTNVKFELIRDGVPKLAYTELIERFLGRDPNLSEVREAILAIRRSKSMVIDPADVNSRSAGSFFKNPVISAAGYRELISQFGDMPNYPADNEKVKIPAAWLIEKAGFEKGFKLKRAGISTNHTLAIVNNGDAGSNDIIELKELIKNSVSSKFGIVLEPEPIFIGF